MAKVKVDEELLPLERAWRAWKALQVACDPEKEGARLIKKVQPQRQDSVTDQLRTVVELATRAGCYDAADLIKARLLG